MEESCIKLKNKKLALFFSYRVSLELWQARGMLARELKLYQELGKYFSKIYFVTYGKDDYKLAEELKKYNIEILYNRFNFPNFLYSIFCVFQYWHVLKQCDFYKSNQMSGSWSGVLAKCLFGKKLLIRMGFVLSQNAKSESRIKFLLSRLVERIVLCFADKIIVATEENKEYFKKYSEKIRIIPNYVDTNLFKPMPEFRNQTNKKIILFIGRLSPEKNLENLLQALVGIENIKLQLIGSGVLEKKLKQESENLHVQVEFLGNIVHEKLPEYINSADIFVLPSLYEGNPKVLLEAMACGSLVLGADVRGINNVINEGVTGFLTVNTSVELNRKINFLLDGLSALSSVKVKESARQFILEKYSLDKVVVSELLNYQ